MDRGSHPSGQRSALAALVLVAAGAVAIVAVTIGRPASIPPGVAAPSTLSSRSSPPSAAVVVSPNPTRSATTLSDRLRLRASIPVGGAANYSWSPDGTRILVSAATYRTCKVFDLDGGTVLEFEAAGGVWVDGKTILSWEGGRPDAPSIDHLRLIDVSGAALGAVPGSYGNLIHSNRVGAVALTVVTPDETWVDRFVVLTAGGVVSAPVDGVVEGWSPDGSRMAVARDIHWLGATGGSMLGWIEVLSYPGLRPIRQFRDVQVETRLGMSPFSPDGRLLAIAPDVFDVETGAARHVPGIADWLSWDRHGRLFALVSDPGGDRVVEIWDPALERAQPTGLPQGAFLVAASAGGSIVRPIDSRFGDPVVDSIVLAADGSLLWAPSPADPTGPDFGVDSWSPDGSVIAALTSVGPTELDLFDVLPGSPPTAPQYFGRLPYPVVHVPDELTRRVPLDAGLRVDRPLALSGARAVFLARGVDGGPWVGQTLLELADLSEGRSTVLARASGPGEWIGSYAISGDTVAWVAATCPEPNERTGGPGCLSQLDWRVLAVDLGSLERRTIASGVSRRRDAVPFMSEAGGGQAIPPALAVSGDRIAWSQEDASSPTAWRVVVASASSGVPLWHVLTDGPVYSMALLEGAAVYSVVPHDATAKPGVYAFRTSLILAAPNREPRTLARDAFTVAAAGGRLTWTGGRNGLTGIWVLDGLTGAARELTSSTDTNPARGDYPSVDGARIAWRGTGSGGQDAMVLDDPGGPVVIESNGSSDWLAVGGGWLAWIADDPNTADATAIVGLPTDRLPVQ